MELITIVALILAVATLLVLVFLLRQVQQVRDDLQGQVTALQQNVSQRFDANQQAVTSHLGIITGQISNTTNVVAQVEGKLGQVQEASRQIFDLARQISSLQNILQAPKMRGGMGEFLLADALSQALPAGAYSLQFPFAHGTIVDAALRIGKRILCIDSKFPLENFRRIFQVESEEEKKSLRKLFLNDVKKHVNDIADRYILPAEHTFDFAFMFIPAENVYYEIIIRDDNDLYSHCMAKRVIPVSPNSFYAFLQVIQMGLRGFQISEQARYILAQLQQLGSDLERFETEFTKTGGHLRDAQSSFERSDLRLQKLKKKVAGMETPSLETQEESDGQLPEKC